MENSVEERRNQEQTGAMAVQDDLENRLTNPGPDGGSGEVGEKSVGGPDKSIGGAEVEGNMFKNIWHEYLFIFVVTSAQLVTVSSTTIPLYRNRANCICNDIASRFRKYSYSYKPYIARAWTRRERSCGSELVRC